MISQIRGKLVFKSSTEVVVECCGVGYGASISVITSGHLPDVGSEVLLLTVLIPREDSLNLFAFHEESEREAFKLLKSVSGIGPKSALGILSSITIDELRSHIISSNLHALQKLPGVGKKTAERLVVELRDKMLKMDDTALQPGNQPGTTMLAREAVSALIALGYNSGIAEKSVKRVLSDNPAQELSAEKIIRLALRVAVNL